MFHGELRCPDCGALLKEKHVKSNECWKCKSENLQSYFEQLAKEAEAKEAEAKEAEAKEAEEKKAKEINSQKIQERESISNTKSSKKYPTLVGISNFYNFLAYASVFLAIVYFIYMAVSMSEYGGADTKFMLFISSFLYGLVAFITFKLISEIIILFVNIANDVSDLKKDKDSVNE